jgi:hypothetical protein
MSEPRSLHYVPCSYLVGFTAEGAENGRLHVLDLYTGKGWPSTPKKAARDRDFYRLDGVDDSLALEKMLGQIEGKTKRLIQEIESSNALPDPQGEDYLELMFFVAVMVARVPRRRADAAKVADRMVKRMLRNNVASPETWKATVERMKAKGLGDFSDTDYAEWKALVEREEHTFDMTRGQHLALMMRSVQDIALLLVVRNWHLQIATEESGEYVTSDHPVTLAWADPRREIRQGAPGFMLQETEVTMPLTRRLALLGRFEGQHASVKVSKRTVATVNDRTMFLARQVYSPAEDFPWLREDNKVGSRADVLNLIEQRHANRTEDTET